MTAKLTAVAAAKAKARRIHQMGSQRKQKAKSVRKESLDLSNGSTNQTESSAVNPSSSGKMKLGFLRSLVSQTGSPVKLEELHQEARAYDETTEAKQLFEALKEVRP
eukprot:scaffold71054_cov46-Prasinocladus_malaysianus.AAC.1